jgi:aryl-alcohol dehydrogenase-like predicted oxidoreductase
MESRRIGSLSVSVVGLGCNNFGTRLDERASERVIHAALDAGITFIDTADVYGKGLSEEYLGRALGPRRRDVILATKFGKPMDQERFGAHPAYIRQAVEGSLRRLRTDHIDLYQLHDVDPEVPIADTLGALDELVRAGKVREIGCSNFMAGHIRDAAAAASSGGTKGFVSVQNEYSLLHREPEAEVLDECEQRGTAFVPYYPLASGLLTGKYHRGQPAPEGSRLASGRRPELMADENLQRVESLRKVARTMGHELLELAFAWLLARPIVASVIAGATKPSQVTANVAAAEWRMTSGQVAIVDADSTVPR